MQLVKQARDIWSEEGLYTFLSRTGRFIERRGGQLPVLNQLCLHLSRRQLRGCIENERTLDDILDTIGTYYQPEGSYRGFGRYRSMRAKQTRTELRQIAEVVKNHEPDTILEIGVAQGGSLYTWVRNTAPNRAISVDIDHDGREPLFAEFCKPTATDLYCITGDSSADATVSVVDDTLDGDSIDFLYIDGDHSYSAVRQDFERYTTFLADDGLVGMHDIGNENTGVPRFWDELKSRSDVQTETIGDEQGLSGIVRFNSD